MKQKDLIPNAPILIESTRSIGYSFESALADIIDNSIGKNAKRIDVVFDSDNEPYLAVIDDACGMSKEELEDAMRYGSKSSLDKRDEKDLGRFGLGLKTASLSQCRSLTVITKRNGLISAAKWDLDHIIEVNGWSLIEYEPNEINSLMFADQIKNRESGTVVIWEKFDRVLASTNNIQKTFDDKICIARKHISLIFHRFMSEIDGVKIYFNYDQVMPIDPFLESNPATQRLVEQSIFVDGCEIKVKPFILPYQSKMSINDRKQLGEMQDLKQSQGFYIYRNKRLIIAGTWFKLVRSYELNKLARIRVDIPNSLDSIWEIDIKKSTASLPDKIKRNLVSVIESTVNHSERVFSYRGRRVNSGNDNIEHVWNVIDDRGSIKYEINKNTLLFQNLENKLDDQQMRYLASFLEIVEDYFPYEDVYYRIAKNDITCKSSKEDFDKLYQIGAVYIQGAKDLNLDVTKVISSLDRTEVFKNHGDVVEKLMEDFKNE